MVFEDVVNRIAMLLGWGVVRGEIHDRVVVQGGVDEETFFFAYVAATILVDDLCTGI